MPALRALQGRTFVRKAPRLVVKNVGPATYSPDGKQLAFVARNTKLELWTLATGGSRCLALGGNVRHARSASGVAAVSRRDARRRDKRRASVNSHEDVCASARPPVLAFLSLATVGSARPQTTNPGGYFTVRVVVTNNAVTISPNHARRGQIGIFLVSNHATSPRVFTLGDVSLTHIAVPASPSSSQRNQQKRVLLDPRLPGPLPAAVGAAARPKSWAPSSSPDATAGTAQGRPRPGGHGRELACRSPASR